MTTVSGYLHTLFVHAHTRRSTTNQVSKHETHQSCVPLTYIPCSGGTGCFQLFNLTFYDTSSRHTDRYPSYNCHTMPILQLQLISAILMKLSHLNLTQFDSLNNIQHTVIIQYLVIKLNHLVCIRQQ